MSSVFINGKWVALPRIPEDADMEEEKQIWEAWHKQNPPRPEVTHHEYYSNNNYEYNDVFECSYCGSEDCTAINCDNFSVDQ